MIKTLSRLFGRGDTDEDEQRDPTQECESCGELYYTDAEMTTCQACGGVKLGWL